MGQYAIRLPDIGEGIAEAELVEWSIEVGQEVRQDQVLAAVMTDKATVEIPSPVSGKVVWFGPGVGETVSIGSEIIRLEVDGSGNAPEGEPQAAETRPSPSPSGSDPAPAAEARGPDSAPSLPQAGSASPRHAGGDPRSRQSGKPVAPPSVRKRALDAGADLRRIPGTGPAGRITHADLSRYLDQPDVLPAASGRQPNLHTEEVRIIGMRRRIAEQMTRSKSRIPHIAYIEEVDVTDLEKLRQKLNEERDDGAPKLTLLPFLLQAMVRAIGKMPQVNARFDDEAGVVHRFGAIHAGIATQTEAGLVVPVVRHAESMGLRQTAAEIQRVTLAARQGSASREELSGSTITITSLGALGGIATTPVINYPEVAIVGVNKIRVAPVWDGHQFLPRSVMNLSSSFDHRIIDGWDAALFVQQIKTLLENPALIFIED
jgi:2-oxoisovalerate dehydrogenase E2 component (dihydrolipoyl transacylase)